MNIKVIKEGSQWFVVVNSVAGQFREDVTHQIDQLLNSEVYQRAIVLAEQNRTAQIAEMREAIDGCLSFLQPFIDE